MSQAPERRRAEADEATQAPWPARLAERLRQGWCNRTLAAQLALLLTAAGLLLALTAAALLHGRGPVPVAWLLAAMLLASLVSSALAMQFARRIGQALLQLAQASRPLRRDDAPDDLNLPLLPHNAELRRTSHAMRRLVEAQRELRQALQARIGQLDQQLTQRTHALTTLQDLSVGLAEASDVMTLIDEALTALEQTVDYTSASVWARDRRDNHSPQVVLMGYRSADGMGEEAGEEVLGKRLSRPNLQRFEHIERSGEPYIENQSRQGLLSWLWEMVVDDAKTTRLYRGTRAWAGVPLAVREQVIGVLRVDHAQPQFFDAQRMRLLSAVASQTALAMHHAQLLVRERDLAVVAERNRIARDLHDAVSQTLFASNVIAGTLARQAAKGEQADFTLLRQQAETIEKLNRGALAEMRMLLFELRPDALDNQPLPTLLQHPIEALECRGDITVERAIAADDPLPAKVRAQVYRIAQEALSNLARHSGASHARVEWRPDAPEGVTLTIRDDGQGFDPDQPAPGHFGVENIRNRAADIGAQLHLRSAPGQGTEVRLVLPPQALAAA